MADKPTEDQLVLVEHLGDIALLTLNAPRKRNAIDQAMVNRMHEVLDDLARREDLAAVVITGAGEKAFAAGADIGQLLERTAADALAGINSGLFTRVEELPVPVIAAIRGYALGGGCELALACDLRIAGHSTRMGQPEVKLGIIPGAGGTYRLPRLVGVGKARELIYTGRIVDATECLRIGLVNEVVDDDQVVERALEIAREIAANGRQAVRAAKATINMLARRSREEAATLESAAQAVLFGSEDKHKRMWEFVAHAKKRKKP